MPDVSMEVVIGPLVAVLREAFEGSPHRWSYFIDHGPDAALFDPLSRLSAVEASRPVGGTPVAAIAPSAYHLGAIRQKVASGRDIVA